ncbi:FAD binding domain-containing protein [Rhodococcus coprophilus]|uniref:Ketone dehydrogenase medium subunit n=1 Tax=Rhodococcus coprophilus TaxID=38310 RepID=A0A2X4TNM8_9NOCA|nr:FAD binding domain-containing protein [Rhodococcus coprophilus]MBM7460696.1 carbon-monoxide dehydrogenase medium subunit [Rhodococcus coprophilus]SQI28503.1 ketone dehydrogenase medium subunit [Rhodococcus coprophilus]
MKPAAFDYHAPETAAEAVDLLAELGDEAKFIAGGQSLMPLLVLRLAVFEHLVDLRRPAGLRGIDTGTGTVRIGATTTHATVGRSEVIARGVPLLARATPLIGHFQIRNRGTIGGSLAHADAAAEYPAVAMTLDADIETLSPRGTRTIPAEEFFQGMWTTAVEPDELVTAVTFPVWTGRCGYAIEEFTRRSGDFAVAGAAVAVRVDADDRIERCAITVFGMGPAPIRARALETDLVGRGASTISARDVGHDATAHLDAVPSDGHGTDGYRRRVGAAMVARAWTRAVEEALDD